MHRYLTGEYAKVDSFTGRHKKEVCLDGQSHLLLIRNETGPPDVQVLSHNIYNTKGNSVAFTGFICVLEIPGIFFWHFFRTTGDDKSTDKLGGSFFGREKIKNKRHSGNVELT